MAERFGIIPNDIWKDKRLLPQNAESEFLKLWFSVPQSFPEMMDFLTIDDFRSPLCRQVVLLGQDLLARGSAASFKNIICRYDQPEMFAFLDGIAEQGNIFQYAERAARGNNLNIFMKDIIESLAFQRIKRQEPAKVSELKDEELDADERQRKLMELLASAQEKHRQSKNKTVLTEEDNSREGQ